DLARIGGAEDAVVRKAGEEGLAGLEDERPEDVAGVFVPDALDLVPELVQPIPNVDAEQLEHQPEKPQPDQPEDDLRDPLSPRWAELDCGLEDAVHQIANGAASRPPLTCRSQRF